MTFAFTPSMIGRIKELNPQARFVMYQWDSEKNLPYSTGIHQYIDQLYTFDLNDCEKMDKYKFLPLFYTRTYEEIGKKKIEQYDYDCSYVGTAHPQKYRDNMPWYLDQISNCTYRQFTTGFYFGKPTEESQIYDSNTYVKEYTYLGIVGEICDGRCKIEQRNKFSVGETIEIMKPDGENVEVTVKRIINEEGEDQESAPHSKQVLYIELEGGQASPYDILRRQEPEVQ